MPPSVKVPCDGHMPAPAPASKFSIPAWSRPAPPDEAAAELRNSTVTEPFPGMVCWMVIKANLTYPPAQLASAGQRFRTSACQ